MRPDGLGAAAAGSLLDELRELAQTRETVARSLRNAIDALGVPDLFESLKAVVEPLPLLFDADAATIRLRGEDSKLHLVAASGCPANDVRIRAVQPIDLEVASRLSDPQMLQRHAESLGFPWAQLSWLGTPGAPLGSVLLASRTQRKPRSEQLKLLEVITSRLSGKLLTLDRALGSVRACALRLARSVEPHDDWAGLVEDEVADLRPRERGVLDLYADGLSTSEIATLLFISPHTVRTHVKSALRTLGVHNRADAARLVRASQVAQLL